MGTPSRSKCARRRDLAQADRVITEAERTGTEIMRVMRGRAAYLFFVGLGLGLLAVSLPVRLLPPAGLLFVAFSGFLGAEWSSVYMATPYDAAPSEKLDEIIRLAEARLAAQLTLGIAADQRAMTFAAFLAAIAAALVAALATLSANSSAHAALIAMTAGFGIASLLVLWSAQPVAWDLPGYPPGSWIDDIAEGDSLHNGRCAMAVHYDEALAENDRVMATNGNLLRMALVAVIATLILAGGAALVW